MISEEVKVAVVVVVNSFMGYDSGRSSSVAFDKKGKGNDERGGGCGAGKQSFTSECLEMAVYVINVMTLFLASI